MIGGLATAGTGNGPSGSAVVGGAGGAGAISTLTVDSATATTFAGSLGGPLINQSNLALVKTGAAALTLSGPSYFTAGTTINGGALKIDNTTGSGTGSGPVVVNSTGILAGTGTIGSAVTVNSGGHLSPGDNSLAALTIASTGSLTLNGGSVLDCDFTNTTSDEVIDNGTLSLLGTAGASTNNSAGVGINVYSSGTTSKFTPTGAGLETFDILQFSGTAPAINTLSVLNPVAGDGYTFGISGNDVTLSISFPPTATWTDNSSDQKWTTGGDWSTNPTVPNSAGSTVNFPGLSGHPMTVDLNGSETVGSITFSTGAAFTISASSGSLTLDNNGASSVINVSAASGTTTTQTISAPIVLAGSLGSAPNVIISTNTSNDVLNLTGPVSGNGGMFIGGPGVVELAASNSYLGGTTINGGTVQINSGSSLGASSAVSVLNAATLEVLNSTSSSQNFQLGSGSSTIQIDGGGTFEIDGNIADGSSPGTLNLAIPGGSGTLILTGSNTYTGGTNIPSGAILQLGNTAGTLGASLSAGGTLTNNGTINVGASAGSPLAGATRVTIGTNITGSGPLNQYGGILSLAGGNANFSGAVSVTDGTLSLGSTSATGTGIGGITLTNSTLTETASGTIGSGANTSTPASSIPVMNISGNLTINTGGANNLTIALQLNAPSGTTVIRNAGTGALAIGVAGNTSYSETAPFGNLFAGTFTNTAGSLIMESRGSASSLGQYNFSAGSANQVLINGIGGSINFGALSGNQPINNANTTSATRLVIGNLNMNMSYSGVVGATNGAGPDGIGILKVGNGTLTLSAANLYAGQALTAVPDVPTVVQAGALIAGSSTAADGSSGPFGPITPGITGNSNTSGINYVLIGSNGTLSSASLQTAGTSIGNPLVISGGGSSLTTGAFTLGIAGSTDANSAFYGGVTLENNLTVSQVANAGSNQLNMTGGITGTAGFVGPDGQGPIDTNPSTSVAAGNSGMQIVTFAGPGNINVSAANNSTNSFAIYDSNDSNPLANLSNGYYSGSNGLIGVAITGGTTTFSANSQYSGGTNISGGTLVLGNLSPALSAWNMSGMILSGGELKLAQAASVSNRNVLVLSPGYLVVPGFTSGTPNAPVAVPALTFNSGLIDMTNNDMVIHGGSVSAVASLIASGYNGGAWNGTTGIVSSTAAADTTHLTALGYAAGGNTFDGISTSPTDVLVKYTYYGDANLDGKVDASDYSLIDNGYLNELTGWYNGDFNYDGVINGSDYTLIDNAFNTQGAQLLDQVASPTAQIAGAAGASAVPEPAALTLFGIGAAGLLGRRPQVRCRRR